MRREGACLIVFLITVITSLVSAYDNLRLQDLQPQTAYELKFIWENALQELQPNCTVLQDPLVNFLLFNRDNPTDPVPVNPSSPTEIDPRKKVVVIVPGWLQDHTSSGIQGLKDAYLKRYDCNLVVADWSSLSFEPYTKGFCHVPPMGDKVGDFLCNLRDVEVRLKTVHVVGHCLGGHIAGFAGKRLKSNCGEKVGRITGLDVASHKYKTHEEAIRLNKNDAEFVDVIHTDIFDFGYYWLCGDADFYPNCGIEQRGCPYIRNVNNDTLVSDVLCHHQRSVDLMIESISSQDLIAVSCGLCPNACNQIIWNEDYVVMGEDCRSKPPWNRYLIPTNSAPPYGMGWDPYSKNLYRRIACQNKTHKLFRFFKNSCKGYESG